MTTMLRPPVNGPVRCRRLAAALTACAVLTACSGAEPAATAIDAPPPPQ